MSEVIHKKKILVAPLNWGLGHASRCVPIVRALIDKGFEPVLASDGAALELLKMEFPSLQRHQLPGYDIRYSLRRERMTLKLLSQVPQVMTAAQGENRKVQELIEREGIAGIISDNRFGVYAKEIPSIYLTHQLKVFSGPTTSIASEVHHKIIRRFHQCWVCDRPEPDALAGELSSNPKIKNVRYIGALSRFEKGREMEKEFDLCFVLSGPEPQRSAFQRRIEREFADHPARMVLVEGLLEEQVSKRRIGNLTVYNYLLSSELESLIEKSALVVSRSGYSTIMDLYALGAKAFFVPTPGQGEQEYLASYMKDKGMSGFAEQDHFKKASLENALAYKGFIHKKTPSQYQFQGLFDVF